MVLPVSPEKAKETSERDADPQAMIQNIEFLGTRSSTTQNNLNYCVMVVDSLLEWALLRSEPGEVEQLIAKHIKATAKLYDDLITERKKAAEGNIRKEVRGRLPDG